MATTRIFYATDVHGSESCFKKFLTAGRVYKANIVILGGDITGKFVIPIVKSGDVYSAQFLGQKRTAGSSSEVEALDKVIRDVGYYPYVTSQHEVDDLQQDKTKVDELFSRLMAEGIRRWMKFAEERLKGSNIKCFVTPGNDDIAVVDSIIKESDYVVNPEGTIVEIDTLHEMISSGYSNITPWNCPRDIPDETLGEKIETMASRVRRMETCIFNLHCPPYASGLDTGPELDKSLKIVMRGSKPSEIPVGSHAVRSAIEKYQPLLGLHGHIHESRATARIGRTFCLNPGSEYTEGILRGAIVDIDEKRVKNHMFVAG